MNLITDRQLFLVAVGIYGVSMLFSLFHWRKGFRQDSLVSYLLVFGAFLFQSGAMALRGFSLKHCPVNNLFEATMFITWTTVACFLAVGLFSKLRWLGAFASPMLFVMGVFGLMPALDPPHGPKPNFVNPLASLHAALIFLSFGAFGLAATAALMYLTQDYDLRFHKLRAVVSVLPPIQRLAKVCAWLATAGLILLTGGLGIYPILLHQKPELMHKNDPILIWSWVIWFAYVVLLVLRWKKGGGRNFAWGALVSFIFIVLTYWGMILLSPIHNS